MAVAAARRVGAPLWILLAACLRGPHSVQGLPRHSKFTVTKAGVIELAEDKQLRLNAQGGAMVKGDPLILWPCSAQNHEIFDFVDNTIRLRSNKHLCLNAEGGAHAGARIISWPCALAGSTDVNEEFRFGEDGRIRLVAHPEMCINVKGGLVELGAQLILWPCGQGSSHSHDIFVNQDGVIQLQANREYHFNAQGGDVTNSVPIVLWRCEPSRHEVFEFTFPDNRMRLKHKPELCVNAEGGLEAGARLILWPCAAEPEVNERFVFDKERQVIHAQAIRTLAFNVKGGNMQNGGEVILWTTDEGEL